MESFSTWWEGLSLVLKIYWCMAVPFTLFFILQLIFSFIGADSPDDLPDSEIESDHGIPFQFLTLKNLIGFFTIFSWTGIACVDAGYSNGITLLISTLAGICMMGIMAGIFYLISRAGADGTMKINNAIGQVGEVYLTIQPNREGGGKIQVKVSGSLRTLDAVTDEEQVIANGKAVKVTGVLGNNILLVTSK